MLLNAYYYASIMYQGLLYNHCEIPYMDTPIRHHKNEDRTWDCLSHSDSIDSPVGKIPLQYSEDHQEKWVQSLAHTVHCNILKGL